MLLNRHEQLEREIKFDDFRFPNSIPDYLVINAELGPAYLITINAVCNVMCTIRGGIVMVAECTKY